MPAYPIPPWLSPGVGQSWAGISARGTQLGLERARMQNAGALAAAQMAQRDREQQQRLAMEQMRLEAQQEVTNREAARREQELAVKAAYEEAVIGLRERDLTNKATYQQSVIAQKSAIEQRKIQQAANQASAMMRLAEAERQKADLRQALMDEAQFLTPSVMGQYRQMLPKDIPDVPLGTISDVAETGGRTIRTGPRSIRYLPPPPATTLTNAVGTVPMLDPTGRPIRGMVGMAGPGGRPMGLRLPKVQKTLAEITLDALKASPSRTPKIQKQIDDLQKQIAAEQGAAMTPMTPATTNAPTRIVVPPGATDEEIRKQLEGMRRGGAAEEGGEGEGAGEIEPEEEVAPEEEVEDEEYLFEY